ncbi:GNAT family N-acetyltransferase [Lactococcus garvieae]|uniref:GNAT family N-acetyltransferase n=1 Tax=Lactococcus garvieae TaxID=1363 RepID=UPI003851EA60
MNQNTMELNNDRLILRRFNAHDIEAIFAIFSDKDVNKYLPWWPLINLEEAQEFYREKYKNFYQNKRGHRYAICLKENNIPIGYIHVSQNDNNDFGYGLRKEFWNKGIITEAANLVIKHLKTLKLPFITATHDRNNPASGEVMKKLGMTYCYSYEEQWQPKDLLVTFRMYQLNLDDKPQRVYMEYWDNSDKHFIEK